MKDLPELSFETIKRMEDMTWFTHAQIFDDLLVVAQKEIACFIWKTGIGLVIVDGIWPDERVYNEIIIAIEEAGWQEEQIAKFMITHGHIDHVGCGNWLVEKHQVATYLSEDDDNLRVKTPHEDGRSDNWKVFPISNYLEDGDVINCGDKSILAISTPGHTDGCMSFIFPVLDSGKEHMACIFGGATPPWNNPNGKTTQKESVIRFMDITKGMGCDVILSNHTAFDNGLERIAYSKNRLSYLPNIYIIGKEGVQRFCEMYLKLSEI